MFAMCESLLFNKMLGEKMIISPFMLVTQLVQFTITLGADGFLSFIIANMIELSSDTFKRATLDPIKLRVSQSANFEVLCVFIYWSLCFLSFVQATRRARENVAAKLAAKKGLPQREKLPEDKAVSNCNEIELLFGIYSTLSFSFTEPNVR
jgi:hypothetical protein